MIQDTNCHPKLLPATLLHPGKTLGACGVLQARILSAHKEPSVTRYNETLSYMDKTISQKYQCALIQCLIWCDQTGYVETTHQTEKQLENNFIATCFPQHSSKAKQLKPLGDEISSYTRVKTGQNRPPVPGSASLSRAVDNPEC